VGLLAGPLTRRGLERLVASAGALAAAASAASAAAGVAASLWLPWPYTLGAPLSVGLGLLGAGAAALWARSRLRLLRRLPGGCGRLYMHRPLREVTCLEGGSLYCVDVASGAAFRVTVWRGPLETRRVSPLDPVPFYCVALLRGRLRGDGSMEGLLEAFWEPEGVVAVVEGRAEPLS